jgi:hypothetical protein
LKHRAARGRRRIEPLLMQEQVDALGRLHLYDVRHIVIDSGRRRFIRLVDDQLNSGLHHRITAAGTGYTSIGHPRLA